MLVNEDEYFRGQVEGDILYGVEGPPGPAGKSAYAYANENGYTGSESDFSRLLGQFPERVDTAVQKAETAAAAAYKAIDALSSSAIVEKAGGEVISISDSAERPLMGMKVYGKTTQNGTPAPEAPAALESVGDDGSIGVTVCGKNLFSATWEQGAIDGSTGENKYESSTVRCGYISVSPLTTYALSRSVGTSYITVRGYDADKSYIGAADAVITLVAGNSVNNPMNGNSTSCTIKTRNNVHYLRFTDNTNDLSTKYQMELGSNVTEYEPYKGGSITISTPNGLPGIPVTSGGNYTDENGQQWLCDEVDFENGVYVQRIGTYVVQETDIVSVSNVQSHISGGGDIAYVRIKSISMFFDKNIPSILADRACGVSNAKRGDGTATTYRCYVAQADGLTHFRYPPSVGMITLEQARSDFVGMNTIYILSEEKTIPLSAEQIAAFAALHTNYPNTTVFNEEGAGMEVKYVADTKLYIDKKFAELAAAIVNS